MIMYNRPVKASKLVGHTNGEAKKGNISKSLAVALDAAARMRSMMDKTGKELYIDYDSPLSHPFR